MNVDEQNFGEEQDNLITDPVLEETETEPVAEKTETEPAREETEEEPTLEDSEAEMEGALLDDEHQVDPSEFAKEDSERTNKKHTSDSVKELNRKQLYEVFLSELEGLNEPEAKLRHVVDFMVAALATKHGAPYFKGFWDARAIALQLFKENINPVVRVELWNKYSELSKEARRLKETLDEQSAFAAEQIEIAIKAIEDEQEKPIVFSEISSENSLLNQNQTLGSMNGYYEQVQHELNLLNAHASRITALRKELIRIEMRVRQKNKFFQRLSALGDKIFPRRKELIKELSQRFVSDIDAFVQRYFNDEEYKDFVFFLREEIKVLQTIAKYLTLNTQAFTYTRMRLSECWDKLKNSDKERKRQRAQHKALYKENAEPLHQKLSEIEQQIQANDPNRTSELNIEAAHNALDEILSEMRQVELGRDEIKVLRDRVTALRQPLIEQAKIEEQQRIEQVQEKEKLKKLKLLSLKNDLNAVIANFESYDAAQLTTKKDELSERISEISAPKMEKQDLERLLKVIKEAIIEKKESDALALSDDDRQAIDQLRSVLQQRKERRQEVKKQLELLRKGAGNSGLDFEQAMNFNNQLIAEKERLDKISEGIVEIERAIGERLQAKGA